MNLDSKITSIMTSQVISAEKNDDIRKVLKLIRDNKIRHLPIVQNRKCVGIVSKSDINRLTFSGLMDGQEEADEAILEMLNLSHVMSHKPRVVNADHTIRDVAEIFANEEFHALPVVDKDENLTGIVTTTDLIKFLLKM